MVLQLFVSLTLQNNDSSDFYSLAYYQYSMLCSAILRHDSKGEIFANTFDYNVQSVNNFRVVHTMIQVVE